jgi:hypothetical protein
LKTKVKKKNLMQVGGINQLEGRLDNLFLMFVEDEKKK